MLGMGRNKKDSPVKGVRREIDMGALSKQSKELRDTTDRDPYIYDSKY